MSGSHVDRALLLARTVRHLRPAQVVHRVRLRGQKAALARAPLPLARALRRPLRPNPGWPTDFLPLDRRVGEVFPDAEANVEGRFCFLGEERELGRPPDWEQLNAAQLWRYHLHYFEWGWGFANHPDRSWASREFRRLWRSWREGTTFGRWDAWSPYVASLRAWCLCGFFAPLVAETDDESDFLHDLALHAGFLRTNLEFDVGGNHLIKNLKALVGLGVFLEDEALVRTASKHLRRQLGVQVLADGGHFERSPSYHCQVLGDLVDVAELLDAAGKPPIDGLHGAVEAMRRWLGAMLMPDGDVPLFNDCTLVGSSRLKLLEASPTPTNHVSVLHPSGYVVMRSGPFHLVADVGPPCPPELPAHAHAECLSFELAVDGQRIITNSGTSTYSPGLRRAYERSTAAHSTIEIDRQNQTEVWGSFRAGRRAGAVLEQVDAGPGGIELVASHDGYERLPGRPRHRRVWVLHADNGSVDITDEVTGHGALSVVSRFYLPVEVRPVSSVESRFEAGSVGIELVGGPVIVDEAPIARRFGELQPATRLAVHAKQPLPLLLTTRIACSRPGRSQPADGLPATLDS